MKLVLISDTHGRHGQLGTLAGDVLIHCGDSSDGFKRDPADLERLDQWFAQQKFGLILCIGGNHDFEIERRARQSAPVFENALYLQDTAVTHEGVVFYGAPWTPDLPGWAFYLPPEEFYNAWARIPAATDVLSTHIGPCGILDRNRSGRSFGCPELLARLAVVRPRLHAFGHNHASAGTAMVNGTLHVNAAMANSRYEICREPFVIDFDPTSTLTPAPPCGS